MHGLVSHATIFLGLILASAVIAGATVHTAVLVTIGLHLIILFSVSVCAAKRRFKCSLNQSIIVDVSEVDSFVKVLYDYVRGSLYCRDTDNLINRKT